MPSLVESSADLPDPRIDRGKLHSLHDIVVLTILAVVCGADNFVAIADYGRARREWLETFLPLENGIPSHDTIGRVYRKLDPESFSKRFMAWVGSVTGKVDGVIPIDGKTVRRSMDGAGNRGPIHLVSAWSAKNRLVLGQVKTSEKSNEITAIPELLEVLDVAGCIVTIDAMGCQKDIAAKIIEGGGDYVLRLKRNHPTLHELVDCFYREGIASNFRGIKVDYHVEETKAHDRDEVRETWVTTDLEGLPKTDEWIGLKSVICVRSRRQQLGKPETVSYRYYLSSLKHPTAADVAAIVRSHWGIENSMHWVLDIAFREDESRVRLGNAPENLALVRRIALNLLGREKTAKVGIKNKRLRAAWDNAYLMKVLSD